MTYKEILCTCGNFMSFDISVHSTGWCKCVDGVFTYGSFGLQFKDDLSRRMEFRRKALELLGDSTYDFVAIEDVILGCNFETTKALIQLNTIIDDLNYLGDIHVKQIYRIANTVWKKRLREVSGVNHAYVGDVKQNIRDCLNAMGFCDDVVQDIYDSIGIAIGAVCHEPNKSMKAKKLKTKLDSYVLHRFSFEKLDELKFTLNVPVVSISAYDTKCKDIFKLFRQTVEEYGDENIFVIEAPLEKFGVLALSGKVPLSEDSRVIAIKRGLKKLV